MSDDLQYLRIRLEYWMVRKGITVDVLSKKAKVSSETMAKIRKHNHIPQPAVVQRLSEALGVPVEQLIVDIREEPAADPNQGSRRSRSKVA